MLSIRTFFVIALVTIMTVFYGVFFYYFVDDQQKKTDLIIESIRHDLSETAYVISSELKTPKAIRTFKSFLHRKVANSSLVSALAVGYENKIVLTTDPSIRSLPADLSIQKKLIGLSPKELVDHRIFETDIHFFIQDKPAHLKLFLYANHAYIQKYFAESQYNFFMFFGLVPFLMLVLLWLVLKRYVTSPLETLRQYAYYQSTVPSKFKLRELEYIRSSMVQTFDRLDKEKNELYRQARTDNLSGLANRNHLNERINWLISEYSRTGQEFAVLFMDLDNFKTVNDMLGHEVGDNLLKNVSTIIQEVLRDYDIIARVGGDEFVIVLNYYQSNFELTHVINRILDRISEVHMVDSHPVKVSASIGVVCFPKDGDNISALMKNADIAMYEAKNSGKNRFKFFTESLHKQVIGEIQLEQDMQRALKNDEFELYFQPKTCVKDGRIVGAEALVRWNDPQKGLVPPNDFIPAAEKTGLMVPLGDWVLKTAIEQQVAWKEQGLADLHISVNLSPVQLIDTLFDRKLQTLINQSGINPSQLDIEMTESQFMENTEQNLNSLAAMREQGITISLDDFGTGYSSLAYLKKFPIDTLKIDKTFIDDYATESGAIFIETIVKIAHTLDLHVVAEGIEQEAQLNYIAQTGCETYQGYYCSAPLPVAEFEAFLKNHPST
ncbi:putative signaling protein [Hydrogenovibrio crunogenus]|uniref:cyclic-guanylate-specific phosphodiesterase n=1 Tax=Hydrogenovibrio crunogenus TaxID=39765 RepID=A0A4P7P1V9_9GAMM|nr:EAL domain-containing protein [Hydrogenovibrio crunogenus]QBZ84068.1 putative signaling protein [Hydrogenovibrio crunogenus]